MGPFSTDEIAIIVVSTLSIHSLNYRGVGVPRSLAFRSQGTERISYCFFKDFFNISCSLYDFFCHFTSNYFAFPVPGTRNASRSPFPGMRNVSRSPFQERGTERLLILYILYNRRYNWHFYQHAYIMLI